MLVSSFEKYELIFNDLFLFLEFISVSKEEIEMFEKKKETGGGQFVNPVDDPSRTYGQTKARVLQSIDTFFYVGTEVSYQIKKKEKKNWIDINVFISSFDS